MRALALAAVIGLLCLLLGMGNLKAQEIQHGPRGGCYILTRSKKGKEYKRYIPCPQTKPQR